jgi:hypothetical protein
MRRSSLISLILLFLLFILNCKDTLADAISDHPIAFVTLVPNPRDFGTLAATFGNHIANPNDAFRGGDLWIRYPDATLKNITATAGYGNSGFQAASAIAVRDPAVHWDGNKIIFSMVIGAATQQYQVNQYRWQLYEVSGIAQGQTPVITKVSNQPENYNNVAAAYASDDSIIFISDKPRDNSVVHTYPQRDEYESAPINSGLWRIEAGTGIVRILDHSPSGNFNPIIDSFGRVIFTRWDHLQRDQQNVGVDFDAFNFQSEVSTEKLNTAAEVFPEPRSIQDPDYKSNINLFTINHFLPWMMNQDGTDMETLNHIGRQEIGIYSERSFNDDPNVEEFYGQYNTGENENEFNIFLHIKEDPLNAGIYLGTNCQEFATHSAGQIISIEGAAHLNPDQMKVKYLTHPDTAGSSNSPGPNHSGLYRDALPLSNGKLIAAHTSNTREDSNIGSSGSPLSRYDFRLKLLSKNSEYYVADSALTAGITKSVSFWSPDQMIYYSGNLWELMPVEVKARVRPVAKTSTLPNIEMQVLQSLGVNINDLSSYLRSQNLALVVSRNLTSRDANDRQQPSNLKVFGSETKSLPRSGKIYEISDLQFFQGDLIRGYGSNMAGRRVLAQPMHSVASGINISGADQSKVKIADDGSMAAFVPANRALSWQMTAPDGSAVVKERFWLTFQAGEMRVCASCHGVNSKDHLNQPAPVNPPQALAKLLAHWKNLPEPIFTPVPPSATPAPNPNQPDYGETPDNPTYSLKLKSKKIKAGAKIILEVEARTGENLALQSSINNKECQESFSFLMGRNKSELQAKLPAKAGVKVQFRLLKDSKVVAKEGLKVKGRQLRSSALKKSCRELMKSFRN